MSTPAIPIQGRPRRNTVQRTPVDHDKSIEAIRTFLQSKDCLSILPVSSKMIVFDTRLQVIKALNALVQNGVVSAPLWSSVESKFAGMLTISDLVHLMQYYYATTSSYEGAADDVEQLTLGNLRDIETAIEVLPPPLHSIHPMRPLLEACHILMTSHARRLPLIDHDDRTDVEVVLSVLTQYRVLKFIAMNCKETLGLQKTLLELNIGTYASNSDTSLEPLAVATMDTTVFDVVHQFSAKGISAVPIVDEEGAVINLYETVDVITLVRLGSYQSLDLTISSALAQRSAEFPGVITCSPKETLANVFSLIAKRRVHRLVMVEDEDKTLPNGQIRRKGALVGIVALSDILKHVIGFKDISIN
ncbi:Nuclear protein SNF4 [Wallemia ichthyophaga EXF-994]|uniref:Nuclear protein SNF4 n=1 Tax=Wallemia ichthyophaga (strain EXF-994 / CBS 113033) TaxID=1299270 RepID=R9AFX2_WALI9|nr:Nuclear protein SNF4 [Wallemia ichthyophaga EXF-994]EOR01025.1 Nuclear protein SNF4 [Wallemia ichthyophaga EXF-994]